MDRGLDEQWLTLSHLGVLVRYADDLVVLCRTRQRAEKARQRVAATLAPLGLHLHPDKTRLVSLAQGRDGFDFLGFHHRLVKSWKWQGRYYLNKWPSSRAMGSIRAKVRQRTDRRYASASMDVIVGSLNPVLRGWGNYFRHGNSSRKFAAVNSYVHQRLARLASTKHGLRGLSWERRFNHRWFQSLGVHRLTGTVGPWGANARR